MDRKSPDKNNIQADNLRIKKEAQKKNLPEVVPNERSSNRQNNGSDGSPNKGRGSNH